MLVVARRGLPRLQREQRACRSSRPTSSRSRCPTRPTSSRATRCASAARASASVDAIDAERRQRRHGHRRARPEARDDASKPLPVDSTVIVRPRSALGLKYVEITRGHVEPGLRRTARRSRCASARARRRVELDEFLNTFDEPTRAAAQQNLVELRRRARRPRRRPQPGDRRARPAAARPRRRWRATCSAPGRRLAALFTARSGARARSSRPSPRPRPRCSATSTRRSPRWPRSRARHLQDSIAGGPRRSTRRSASFPHQRPFLANTEALFRELRPGAEALRAAAPDLADALVVGHADAATLAAVQPRSSPDLLQALQASPTTRSCRSASSDLTETANVARTRRSPTSTPAQTDCNYVTLLFRNTAIAAQRGRHATARGSASSSSPRRRAPTTRATPSSAPANGADGASNFLHSNPYPNTAAPGQPQRVRGRQRALPRRAQGDRQPAGHAGATTSADGGTPMWPAPRPRAARPRNDRRGCAGRPDRCSPSLVIAYFGFTKDIPFTHGFELKAVFQSANSSARTRRCGSPASNVGKVKSIKAHEGTNAAAGHDGDRRRPGCRSTRTRRRRSGRASSSRATSSSTCSRARRPRRRSTDGDTITVTQTSTRSSSTRC